MDIRLARPDDVPALSAFMARTFLAAYGHTATPDAIARHVREKYTPEMQRAELDDPNLETWLACRDGSWLGYAQLHYASQPLQPVDGEHPAEVRRFYLDPERRGQGVGAVLMTAMCEAARARGRDGLWLSTWQGAAWAIRFYEKAGFRIMGSVPFLLGGVAEEDWLMSRSLR